MQQTTSPASVRLEGYEINPQVVKILPKDLAIRFHIAPLWFEENELVIAAPDPFHRTMLHEVAKTCNCKVVPVQASYAEISNLISRQYGLNKGRTPQLPLSSAAYTLGYLGEDSLKTVPAAQDQTNNPLAGNLSLSGLKDEANRIEVLGLAYYKPHLRLDEYEPLTELGFLLSQEDASENKVVPLWWVDGILVVGVSEERINPNLRSLSEKLGFPLQSVLIDRNEWGRIFRKLYLHGNISAENLDRAAVRWLVDHGQITKLHLDTAEQIHTQTQRSFASIFLSEKLVASEDWAQAVSAVAKKPLAPSSKQQALSQEEITILTRAIPLPLARRIQVVPLRRANPNTLIVGALSPEPGIIRLVQKITGFAIQVQVLDSQAFEAQVKTLYASLPQSRLNRIPRLGDWLLSLKLVTKNQVNEAQTQSQTSGLLLGEQLVRNGHLDDSELAHILGLQNNMPSVNLAYAVFNQDLINSLPKELLVKHSILPILATETDIWVAIPDPQYLRGIAELEEACGKLVWPVAAPKSVIQAALDRLIGMKTNLETDPVITTLIELLVQKGCITQVGATRILGEYNRTGCEFDKAVLKASAFNPRELYQAMADGTNLPFLDININEENVKMFDALGQEIEKKVARDPVHNPTARLIDAETAKRLCALPVRMEGSQVVVVFADPLYARALAELRSLIEMGIIPALAERQDIENAIQRNLGRKNLGTALLLAGIITRSQLNNALDYADRTGVKLGRALLERGFITWDQLAEFLAQQAGMPFCRLFPEDLDNLITHLVDPFTARKYGFLPFRRQENELSVAIVDPLDTEAVKTAQEILKEPLHFILVSPRDFDNALQMTFRNEFLTHSTRHLLERIPDDSAFKVLSARQWVGLGLMVILALIWMVLDIKNFLIVTNSLATIYYIIFSGYRLYLVYHALTQSLEIDVTKEELEKLDERDLPVYTLLVPVYKEAAVLPELLEALSRLDYPRTKLDIKILLEEDDKETIEVYNNWNAPAHFQGLIVPFGLPKTKPKACNYGLIHASGEFIVIFDAEDLPDPDQLKKNVIAFSKAEPNVVCIQNKLNYYNRGQNLLTGWFTIEYSMWFDLFLPGLDATGAPVPLGGTSNHFRTNALVDVGAWDPHNVTEDADLGVRLYKRGYKTAIVDSTTYEEANSQFYNWIRQRSRWIKGYMQTWLVHMRHPLRLLDEMGWKGFWGFQFTVGGTFFSALMNPIYWLLTTLWFWRELPFIQAIFPGVVFYMGAACLFLGNFAFTYMFVAGALHRGYFEMVKFALISPLYWGLSSIAAWKGFIQLVTQPHFWEKTTHGLNQGHRAIQENANTTPKLQ